MQAGEAVRSMGAQVQEALVVLAGCSHWRGGDRGLCAACSERLSAILKRAQETAARAGWRGPDVF